VISLTDARLKRRSTRHGLAVVLLTSLILLIGPAGHFTAKLESTPVDAYASIARNLATVEPPVGFAALAAGAESQAPVAPVSPFAPVLDIVPLQDGTGLFISAGGVGELDETVFANIGVGPGHQKGGWTMTYSDTVQAYVTTAAGFTPTVGASGSINITTTGGLDTGGVDFNRAYVPASTVQTIRSIDGNLELELADTDVITFNTYVAVVPSYAPPGPAPVGHRFVGSPYSVRAAGALVETDASMSLRLFYNDATLAGADPHTLAIFRWDAANKHWDNWEGTPFFTHRRLSVPTRLFNTYTLMATPAWHDSFYDLSGMDPSQFGNVTWSGGQENRLLLASTPGTGSAVSKPITPTTAFVHWGSLTFARTADPPTTTLTVDVLSLDGSAVLTDVISGAELSSLDATSYPALKLRANLSSTVAGETPTLDTWRLAWEVKEYEVYLPCIVRSG
jgi:hypothetical protein